MVCVDKGYDDVRGLRELLEDVEDGKLEYEETSEARLVEFAGFLMKTPENERSWEDGDYYCEMFKDFCLGQIIDYRGNFEKQLGFYRLRKLIQEGDLGQLFHYLNKSEYFFEGEI